MYSLTFSILILIFLKSLKFLLVRKLNEFGNNNIFQFGGIFNLNRTLPTESHSWLPSKDESCLEGSTNSPKYPQEQQWIDGKHSSWPARSPGVGLGALQGQFYHWCTKRIYKFRSGHGTPAREILRCIPK